MTPYFDGQKYFRALLQDLRRRKKKSKWKCIYFERICWGADIKSLLVEKARVGVEIFYCWMEPILLLFP